VVLVHNISVQEPPPPPSPLLPRLSAYKAYKFMESVGGGAMSNSYKKMLENVWKKGAAESS